MDTVQYFLYSAMASSYQAERDLKEKQKLFSLGVTGIPFGHSNSVQDKAVQNNSRIQKIS